MKGQRLFCFVSDGNDQERGSIQWRRGGSTRLIMPFALEKNEDMASSRGAGFGEQPFSSFHGTRREGRVYEPDALGLVDVLVGACGILF